METEGIPFAVVDDIADASPAAEDGLQLGDQIVKFGNVEAGDDLLQRLASESQKNQGGEVPVVLMRQGAIVNVTAKPRTWQGRGLLGYDHDLLFASVLLGSWDAFETSALQRRKTKT